jgi:hypothetical protein
MTVKTTANPDYDHPFGLIVGLSSLRLSRCRDCGKTKRDLRHRRRVPVIVLVAATRVLKVA